MQYRDIELEATRKRVRGLRLSIKPDGRVCLTIPLLATTEQVETFLSSHYAWLVRNRDKMLQRLENQQRTHYETGEKHLLWGRELPLRIEPEKGRESVALYDDEIVLYCHPDRGPRERKKLLYQHLYYPQFVPVLREMLAVWEARLGRQGNQITIRLMRSEWGSCTPAKRHMTFNVDMARLPRECMEYVVVHELTHFDHCDHSPAFWALCDQRLVSVGLENSKAQRARIKKIIRTCGGD